MYELWDLGTGNLIDSFPTEVDALHWVCRSLKDDGPEFAHELAMFTLTANGARIGRAQGGTLVALARSRVPAA